MVDDRKRNFIKHLGLVSAAGAVGIGISYLAATPPEDLIDDLQVSEQYRSHRKVCPNRVILSLRPFMDTPMPTNPGI